MKELPDFLERGERARLFPVLADTSKEGRTLSIFLSCMSTVDEFGKSLLASLGAQIGTRAKIEAFTEVGFKKSSGNSKARPDGLILVTSGQRKWSAIVEAKVGNSEITDDQIATYLEIAKLNNVDAIITLSNQIATIASHHPLPIPANKRGKVSLFHWSWMYVVTQADLLLDKNEVTDREQRVILHEMSRFLLHPSSGVKGFDQMPTAWSEVVSRVVAGGTVAANSAEAKDVVSAWHQEVGDMAMILSRQLETSVDVKLSRAHENDPGERMKADLKVLADDAELWANLAVPDAAATISVCANIKTRSIMISMWLRAPDEPKSSKARVNWVLKQLQNCKPAGVHVRCYWPGRATFTQYPLAELRARPELVAIDRPGQALQSFDLLYVKDLGSRFANRRNFITELESAVSEFYREVGEHVRVWQAPAPRVREEKAEPQDVGTDALREEVEQEALTGDL